MTQETLKKEIDRLTKVLEEAGYQPNIHYPFKIWCPMDAVHVDLSVDLPLGTRLDEQPQE